MFFWKESIISVWFQDSLSDNDLEEMLRLQREDELKALHRQLMRKKAKLEELENSDESLVAEMAALLSKIEETFQCWRRRFYELFYVKSSFDWHKKVHGSCLRSLVIFNYSFA